MFGFSSKVRDIALEIEEYESVIDLTQFLSAGKPIIVTATGKSAFISQKFCATLRSYGFEAHFVYSTDALHGDLGVFKNQCSVLIVSNSGSGQELVQIGNWLNLRRQPFGLLVGRSESVLGRLAAVQVCYGVVLELDEVAGSPSVSSLSQLFVLEAVAHKLAKTVPDLGLKFLENHPAGSLGSVLYDGVIDYSVPLESIPSVVVGSEVDVVSLLLSSELELFLVHANDGSLFGLFTRGDFLRWKGDTNGRDWIEFVGRNLWTIGCSETVASAINRCAAVGSSIILVVDASDRPLAVFNFDCVAKP